MTVRRAVPLPLLVAVAAAAALAAGIPAGLAAGSTGTPEAGLTVTPTFDDSTGPTTTAPPTTSPPSTSPPTTSPPDTGSAPPPDDPPDLSAAQLRLSRAMEMDGLDRAGCTGYPAGEDIDGVVAALECPVEDPDLEQPAILYQFDGASSLRAYLQLRATDVDRTGECADGDEMVGTWRTGDRQVGSVVCVDNPKDGTTYFKIIFSSDTSTSVVVVQDDSAAQAYAWWLDHAAGQFYGVGPS